MELKLINDQGQPAATVAGSDALFARDYNEALIHQVVTAYQANARQGNRAQKGRSEIDKSHPQAVGAEGHRPRPRRPGQQPAVARRRQDFPNSPDENFSQKLNARCIARVSRRSCRSSCARTG